jgi:hypothetical protein
MTYLPSILIGTEVCIRATRPANKLAEVALDRFSAKNSERIYLTLGFVLSLKLKGVMQRTSRKDVLANIDKDERVRARKWRIAL